MSAIVNFDFYIERKELLCECLSSMGQTASVWPPITAGTGNLPKK